MSPLFRAVVKATEEAIVNSIPRCEILDGRDGHRQEAIPLDSTCTGFKACGDAARKAEN